MAAFERELALEPRGHLYAKECCANAWYAIGAGNLRHGDSAKALAAFEQAIARVPRHPMARAGLAILGHANDSAAQPPADQPISIDLAMARAAVLVARGEVSAATNLVASALDTNPPGNGGWLIPLDPLLSVASATGAWAAVLQKLRDRAA
jgi:hypothetical protein